MALPSKLLDTIYLGDYDKTIQQLADLAAPEDWTYQIAGVTKPKRGRKPKHPTPSIEESTSSNPSNLPTTPNAILKTYLINTFDKVYNDNQVITSRTTNVSSSVSIDYLLFNTGLYTANYESIYLYAEKNLNPNSNTKWYFKRFVTEYDLCYYNITEFPKRANYFSNPELLIFDPTCPIKVQYRHILNDKDNISRLPDSIRRNKNLQALLEGSIEIMKRRVSANYKIPIPQYYNGSIQLLLPICLRDESTADMALVVTKVGDCYQGHTCISIEMAYNNARLIARPDESSWINIFKK